MMIDYKDDPRAVLIHFNPYHDPKNGQFTDKNGNYTGQNSQPSSLRDKMRNERGKYTMGVLKNLSSSLKLTEQEKKDLKQSLIIMGVTVGLCGAIYVATETNAIDKFALLLRKGVKEKSAFEDAMTEIIDEETMLLKKGSIIHRMEAFTGLDISSSDRPSYVVYKKPDVATYMTLLRDWSGTGERYDTQYESIIDLKIPTKKKAKRIFEDLYRSNPQYRKALQDTLIEAYRELVPGGRTMSKGLIQQYIDREFGGDRFAEGMYAFVRRGEDSKILRDTLHRCGFDAIEDYFDKGVMSESPLILLDPKSSVRKTGEQFVDKALKTKTVQDLILSGKEDLVVRDVIAPGRTKLADLLRMIRLGVV